MEGSRHEKAAVTVASYVIGFITAFLLYANINTPNQQSYVLPTIPGGNMAAVAAAVPTDATAVVPDVAEKASLEITYLDGKLEVSVGDTTNLLSFNPELSEENIDTTDIIQGYHFGELKYFLSEDKSFVFFCEQHDIEVSTCSGFVYDVKGSRIYPVIKDGTPVDISERSANEAIWTLFGLKIGAHYSANPKAPWVLISDDSQLDLQ